jgi:ankyrin repeat protein
MRFYRFLTQFPDSEMVDEKGELPIHIALRENAALEEVRAMLDAGGDAQLDVPDMGKRLPLHFAAYGSTKPDVMKLLLARGPTGALRAEDGNGRIPLARAERPGNHGSETTGKAEIIFMLKAAAAGHTVEEYKALTAILRRVGLPEGTAAEEARVALNTPDEEGYLPIHKALWDDAGLEEVRAMLDVGGDAQLAVPDSAKALPLHSAASMATEVSVVALLLARGPVGSARVQDGAYGETSLVRAEKWNEGPAKAEIVALLKAALSGRSPARTAGHPRISR